MDPRIVTKAKGAFEALERMWNHDADIMLAFTDLDEFPYADLDPDMNYTIGYLNGLAAGMGVSAEHLVRVLKDKESDRQFDAKVGGSPSVDLSYGERVTMGRVSKPLLMSDGYAWKANLKLDGKSFLTIEQNGRGGSNFYAPATKTIATSDWRPIYNEIEAAARVLTGEKFEALDGATGCMETGDSLAEGSASFKASVAELDSDNVQRAAVAGAETGSEKRCPQCGRMDCYAHCRGAEDGRHVSDPASVRIDQDAGRNRGVDWVVDVDCQNCDVSGATRIDHTTISWE